MAFSYANAATNKNGSKDKATVKTPAWQRNKQMPQRQHPHTHTHQQESQTTQQHQNQQRSQLQNSQNNGKLPTTSTWGVATTTSRKLTTVLSRSDNELRSDSIKNEETQARTTKATLVATAPQPTNVDGKTNNNINNNNIEWNIVAKKNVSSSTAVTSKHSRTLRTHPQAVPNNKDEQHKHISQQRQVSNHQIHPNNNNNDNNKNSNSNSSKANKNPRPPNKNISNANIKKNFRPKPKPKPKIMSIGDMITEPNKKLVKKKNNSGNNKKKKSSQEPRQQQEQKHSNLHIDSFPTLGSVGAESVSLASTPSTSSKVVWGSLPKLPPASSTSLRPDNVASVAIGTQITNPLSSPLSSSLPSPSKKKKQNSVVFMGAPSRVLKRGETLVKTNNMARNTQAKGNDNKNKKKKKTSQNKDVSIPGGGSGAISISASSFFQPKLRSVDVNNTTSGNKCGSNKTRGLEGEEHELLRLMQERTIYQKNGRQRVAPRKKKFTALKKKILQERLDQWRKLHPEESASEKKINHSSTTTITNTCRSKDRSPITCCLCIHNYTTPEELEDEDEYEEILENLKGMSLKIGSIDEVFIPRNGLEDKIQNSTADNSDSKSYHPAFVKFQKVSDAAAALACWNGFVVGGISLEAVGLDVPSDDGISSWSERALAAEFKRRNESQFLVDEKRMIPIEIILQKILTVDDYDDVDCMGESLDDLKQIAEKFGELQNIRADDTKNGDVVITYVSNLVDAQSIAESLCRVVVGGQPLYATVSKQSIELMDESSVTILLKNILTEDDLEDNDCLQESLNDIKELCLQYGSVSDVVVKGLAVKITYSEDILVVENAVSQLNGTILGGNIVEASLLTAEIESTVNNSLESCVDLLNFLTEDDLEDEECMEESISDVRKLASKYGETVSIDVLKEDANSFLRIKFGGGVSIALKAVDGFRGMVIGGQIINAILSGTGSEQSLNTKTKVLENSGDKRKSDAETITASEKKARTDDKAPLYSGDKLIPERFAKMKRVPKIPNVAGRREYASTTKDERVRPLLTEMLGELMRLQKRAVEDKNAKARRRMVMGLREVARGIRSHKVKMIVMANNLDQYGAIDAKLQEIIDLAKSEGVPLFFEFTKRSLGKAIGKSIKIAVIGIQNADGAHQPFKKLNAISSRI